MSKVDPSALSHVEPSPPSSGGAADALRLNIGAGDVALEGFTPIDRKNGQEAFPLDYPDESVDELRASHVLEHFSHRQTMDVLKDWSRVLKPGGVMKIAVPNFDWICEQYLRGREMPTESFVMGGHVDSDDVHGALFQQQSLTNMMQEIGLRRIEPWVSDIEDCASLEVSLNLQGVKQEKPDSIGNIMAVMSTPRLGFMDNFFSAYQALMPLGIHFRKYTGAFWDQCLQRVIEQSLEEDNADAILTIDYDSIFDIRDVKELIRLAEEYPEADAICGLQSSRATNLPLMTMVDEDGKPRGQVERAVFDAPLTKVNTGHFGLTLIRRHVFDRMEKPWFWSKPADDGSWAVESNKVDADIYFWNRMRELDMSLYMANRVVVGHGEFMVRWPGRDFSVMYQHPNDYFAEGKPKDAWQ